MPMIIPEIPPMRLIANDSMTNCERMSVRHAPIARRTPISRVLQNGGQHDVQDTDAGSFARMPITSSQTSLILSCLQRDGPVEYIESVNSLRVSGDIITVPSIATNEKKEIVQ
jgi:hypothetical protein